MFFPEQLSLQPHAFAFQNLSELKKDTAFALSISIAGILWLQTLVSNRAKKFVSILIFVVFFFFFLFSFSNYHLLILSAVSSADPFLMFCTWFTSVNPPSESPPVNQILGCSRQHKSCLVL